MTNRLLATFRVSSALPATSIAPSQGAHICVSFLHDTITGTAADDEVDDSILNAVFSSGFAGTKPKKARAEIEATPTIGSTFAKGSAKKGDDSPNVSVWEPVKVVAVYKDSKMTQHCLVAIWLPSGCAKFEHDSVTVNVESGGEELVVRLEWSPFLVSVDSLHRVWIPAGKDKPDDIDCCLMMQAFSEEIASQCPSDRSIMWAEARIPLDIVVSKKTNFVRLLGESKHDTRVLYIDLKAEESTYKTVASSRVEIFDEAAV